MGDLITLNCPSCGGQLEVNSKTSILQCHFCGAEHLVRREGGAVLLESYARCPKCKRNDRVEKVTAILRSQPESSGLVDTLARPERPALTQNPQPLPRPETPPKPEKTPKPKLKPKPEPPPIPMIEYRRKNHRFIIGGVVLFIISYLSFIIFLGMSFDVVGEGYRICSGISLIPLILSIFLFYKGHTWKKGKIENNNSLQEYLNRSQKDPNKQKSRFTVLSTIFFVIAVVISLISLILLPDEIGGFVFLLGFSFLPAIFGFYFLFKARSTKKREGLKRPSFDELKLALEKWEEKNASIENNWARENARLLHEWEAENSQILEQWEAKNARIIENWDKENKRRLYEWKHENNQIPQQYRDVMERWEELYFCHRDDVVFIPGEGTYAPVEKMNEYLHN